MKLSTTVAIAMTVIQALGASPATAQSAGPVIQPVVRNSIIEQRRANQVGVQQGATIMDSGGNACKPYPERVYFNVPDIGYKPESGECIAGFHFGERQEVVTITQAYGHLVEIIVWDDVALKNTLYTSYNFSQLEFQWNMYNVWSAYVLNWKYGIVPQGTNQAKEGCKTLDNDKGVEAITRDDVMPSGDFSTTYYSRQEFWSANKCDELLNPTPTATMTSTPTSTPGPTVTGTPTATMTSTPTSTSTNTPTSTPNPTNTPNPTSTPTAEPTVLPPTEPVIEDSLCNFATSGVFINAASIYQRGIQCENQFKYSVMTNTWAFLRPNETLVAILTDTISVVRNTTQFTLPVYLTGVETAWLFNLRGPLPEGYYSLNCKVQGFINAVLSDQTDQSPLIEVSDEILRNPASFQDTTHYPGPSFGRSDKYTCPGAFGLFVPVMIK